MNSTSLPRGLRIITKLGSGGYGQVYLTQHEISHKKYVVKVFQDHPALPMTTTEDREIPLEIAILRSLHHPNIVKYKNHFRHLGEWYLVMDYEQGFQDLYTLSRKYKLDETAVKEIGEQLYEVMDYCLQSDIDHGDIKEENLLYNPKTRQLRLIDFGSALPLSRTLSYSQPRGTELCLPPEAFSKPAYYPLQAAVWSYGCVMFGVMTGKSAFQHTSEIRSTRRRVPGTERKGFSEGAVRNVERCLEPCQIRRIMWTELGRNL